MGLLVSSLWRRLFALPEFKACLVGLDNAGKTTILFQLHMGEVVETQPTIGSNVETVQHKNVHFNVVRALRHASSERPEARERHLHLLTCACCLSCCQWDLGGQESLRQGWHTYYLGAHAVIVVVDSTDRSRIDLVKLELDKLLANAVRQRGSGVAQGMRMLLEHRCSLGVLLALCDCRVCVRS